MCQQTKARSLKQKNPKKWYLHPLFSLPLRTGRSSERRSWTRYLSHCPIQFKTYKWSIGLLRTLSQPSHSIWQLIISVIPSACSGPRKTSCLEDILHVPGRTKRCFATRRTSRIVVSYFGWALNKKEGRVWKYSSKKIPRKVLWIMIKTGLFSAAATTSSSPTNAMATRAGPTWAKPTTVPPSMAQ